MLTKFILKNIATFTKDSQITAFSILGIVGPKGDSKFQFEKEENEEASVEEKILNDVCKLCINQK